MNKVYYVLLFGVEEGILAATKEFQEGSLLISPYINTGNSAFFEPITDRYFKYYPEYKVFSRGVHADHHNITLIPVDEARKTFYILNGNDGGIALSKDGGKTFVQTGDLFKEEFNFLTGELISFPTFKGYNTRSFMGWIK